MFSTAIRSFHFFPFTFAYRKIKNFPSSWNNLKTKQSCFSRCGECRDFFQSHFNHLVHLLWTLTSPYSTFLDWIHIRICRTIKNFCEFGHVLKSSNDPKIKRFANKMILKTEVKRVLQCMMNYLNFPGLCNVVLILLIMASGLMVPHHTYVN